MKNRRNVLIAFLLCATLIVGVGYAAFSGNLIINGTATYTFDGEKLDEDIYFSGYENLSHCNVSIEESGDTAALNVTFTAADAIDNTCTATATFIIKNESLTNAVEFIAPTQIIVNSADNTPSIFTVTVDMPVTTLEANSTIRVNITVTANIQGIGQDRTGTFVVQLPATQVVTE